MKVQIDVLREVFVEWLRMHELDYDFWIFTRAQWAEKEGDGNYLKDAELVIAFENSLYTHFNSPGEYNIEDELQDLANGFGYYFEFGNHWNIGFYPLEEWPPLPSADVSYADKLRDSRWHSKRKRILQRCGGLCEECEIQTTALEVHHCYYRYGREPWQYPDGALLALCRSCHKERADAELRFRLFTPTLRTTEMILLRRVVRHCQYWFDSDDFLAFLATLGNVPGGIPVNGTDGEMLAEEQYEQRRFLAEYRALRQAIFQMLKRRGRPEDRGDGWPRNWA